MLINERIAVLAEWGRKIGEDKSDQLAGVIEQTYHHNKWLTEANTRQSIKAIVDKFLDVEALYEWLYTYNIPKENPAPKTVAILMAGNLPMVGFHDLLCVLATGHQALVKLSAKDQFLLPYFVEGLRSISSELAGKVGFVEQLKGIDAVIATGSNNSSRYFEQYFGKYSNIIRKHRNAVAILTGQESAADLQALAEDIFSYYGLGCRNVSKLFVPEGYDFKAMYEAIPDWKVVMDHPKYHNNYDYYCAVWLLNKEPFLTNDFLMVKEDRSMASPVSSLYYETYSNLEAVAERIREDQEGIQVVVGDAEVFPSAIPFGTSQSPGLSDYADEVDTVGFLLGL